MKAFYIIYTAVLAFSFPLLSIAQNLRKEKITISGYVKDNKNGESLPGVVLSVNGTALKTTSNNYGFYSLSLPAGKCVLSARYMGYKITEKSLDLTSNQVLDFTLQPASAELNEVVISASQKNKNLQNTQMGITSVSIKSVKQIPALLGEADVIRTIQLLPGVSSVGEGATGFNVRGGGVDQNLVLLDEATVYNSSHLLGFFSVFNPDAVKDLTLMKSEMPARYGGRLSSLLDVRMKDGNSKKFGVGGGLGVIASRLMIEGPIQKDKSSFIIAGRRSFTDLMMHLSSDPEISSSKVYFYDVSSKANFKLSSHNQLFISGYAGRDVNQLSEILNMNWGNSTGTLRWNHVYNQRLFSNISLIASRFDYTFGITGTEGTDFDWKADISDLALKTSFTWYPDPSNTIYFGGDVINHGFSPGKAVPVAGNVSFNTIEVPKKAAREYAAFWDHETKITDWLSFQYGLRYSGFEIVSRGNSEVYEYVGQTGTEKLPVNPKTYHDGQTIKMYHNLEPRATLKIQTSATTAIKASVSRTVQNMHFVSNTMAASPLDIWVPGSATIKPQYARQMSAGYFYGSTTNTWEASVETYYRKMNNQIDFISGAQTLLNDQLEASMLFGVARAYGAEFYAKKNSGKLNGWISYTLSRTERKIEGLNNSNYYAEKYDKTHVLAIAAMYQYKPRLLVSATFNYATGTPMTLPDTRFDFQGFPVQYNSQNSRSNFRVDSYQRLDLGLTLQGKVNPQKRFHSDFVFSLYNVLGRRNPYSIFFRQKEENVAQTEAIRYAVIGSIIPSVTWNFKF